MKLGHALSPLFAIVMILTSAGSSLMAEAGKKSNIHQLSEKEISGIFEEHLGQLDGYMGASDYNNAIRWFGLSASNTGLYEDKSAGNNQAIWDESRSLIVRNNRKVGTWGMVNEAAGNALGDIGSFNIGFDLGAGMRLSEMGKNAYPPGLSSFFNYANFAGFCMTTKDALVEMNKVGHDKVSGATYLKVAGSCANWVIGAKSLIQGAGGPAIGVAFFIFDMCMTEAQKIEAKYMEAKAYQEYHFYFIKEDWSARWIKGDKEGIRSRLEEYWTNMNLFEPKRKENAEWAVLNIPNYKKTYAAIYMRQTIAPRLAHYFELEAQGAKEDAIDALHKYLSTLHERKAVIMFRVRYENYKGDKIDSNAVLDYTVEFMDYELDQNLVVSKQIGNLVRLTVPFTEYIVGLSKSVGTFNIEASTTINGKITPVQLRLAYLDMTSAIDSNNGKIKVYHEGNKTIIAPQKEVTALIHAVPIKVKVIGSDGMPLKQGTVNTASGTFDVSNGVATVMIPSAGESWIVYVDSEGAKLTSAVTFDGSKSDLSAKGATTLRLAKENEPPPLPPKPVFNIDKDLNKTEKALKDWDMRAIDRDQLLTAITSVKHVFAVDKSTATTGMRIYTKAFDRRESDRGADFDATRRTLSNMREKLYKSFKRAEDAIQYYYDSYAKLEEQLKNELMANDQRLATIQEETDKISSGIFAAAREIAIIEKVALIEQAPQEFETLADVEIHRKNIAKMKAKAEKLLRDTKSDQTAIKDLGYKLLKALGKNKELRAAWLKWQKRTYDKALWSLGTTERAFSISEAMVGDVDPGAMDTVIRELIVADGVLSWLQLKCVADQNTMKKFDALLAATPSAAQADSDSTKMLRSILHKGVGAAKSGSVWAHNIAKRREDEVPNNGYGMESWEHYAPYAELWRSNKDQMQADMKEGLAWAQKSKTLRDIMSTHLVGMKEGGWIVKDIHEALSVRVINNRGERAAMDYKTYLTVAEKGVAEVDTAFSKSEARVAGEFDKVLVDLKKYRILLANGMKVVEAGNLSAAEKIYLDGQKLLCGLGRSGQSLMAKLKTGGERQRGIGREVLLDFKTYKLEERFYYGLGMLQGKDKEARLVTLIVKIEGAGALKLKLSLKDSADIERSLWFNSSADGRTRTVRMEPGSYVLSAAGTAVRAKPESQKVTLGRGQSKTVNLKLISAISSGNSSTVQLAGAGNAKYNFATPKSRIIAVGLGMTGKCAPAWSSDGTVLIAARVDANDSGLTALDLKNGKIWKIITENPVHEKMTSNSANHPIRFGDNLFYEMGVNRYRYDKRQVYVPWMSVPVKGAKPVLAFELVRGNLLFDVRKKNGKSEFLLLQKKNDKLGLFLITEENLDPEKSKPFSIAKVALKARVSISGNWRRLATADHWKPWTVYNSSGSQVAVLPKEFGDQGLALNSDGTYAAGPTTDAKTYEGQMAVAPVDNSGQVHVLHKGAIRYGKAKWSPDGRYLAFSVFGETYMREELVIIDLIGGSNSYADGKTLFTRK